MAIPIIILICMDIEVSMVMDILYITRVAIMHLPMADMDIQEVVPAVIME